MRRRDPGTLELIAFSIATLLTSNRLLDAHEGHQAVTYEVTPAWKEPATGSYLRLRITDDGGRPIAARFSLTINGKPYIPQYLGSHGLRFVSIHQGRGQSFVATYSRGTGEVTVPLPDGIAGKVTVARGFEYRAAIGAFEINGEVVDCSVRLRRWINLADDGWQAADEHVHYERTDAKYDADWLTMLEADGLAHAHFLVLKEAMCPASGHSNTRLVIVGRHDSVLASFDREKSIGTRRKGTSSGPMQ